MKPRTHFWSGLAYCALLHLGAMAQASAQGPNVMGLVSSETSRGALSSFRTAEFSVTESAFAREQLRHSRVRLAQLHTRPTISRLFNEKNIRHPAAEVFLRVFKHERVLEVWVRPVDDARFQLLRTYGICALAGKPGPKRRQGDAQVPEGFYYIDMFNPTSAYHLSLRINYPNARDAAVNGSDPGDNIYIHGGCQSEGCLAVNDGTIEELYWIAVEARAVGQQNIPVHIFPARLNGAEMDRIKDDFRDQPDMVQFWKTLRPGYEYFERNHRLPQVYVDADGSYRLSRGG
ncbi:MAG: L,D-transpeptidase family protein [Gemmatimonadota bacterium]